MVFVVLLLVVGGIGGGGGCSASLCSSLFSGMSGNVHVLGGFVY